MKNISEKRSSLQSSEPQDFKYHCHEIPQKAIKWQEKIFLHRYRNSAYRTANQIKWCCAQCAYPSHSAKGVLLIVHTVFGKYMQRNENYHPG